MIRILVISPSPVLRAGLRALLTGPPDFEIVADYDKLPPTDLETLQLAPDVTVVCPLPTSALFETLESEALDDLGGILVLGPVSDEAGLAGRFEAFDWGY